jgi:hypothetical protein
MSSWNFSFGLVLVILCTINVYFIHQTRIKSPNIEAKPETTKDENNSRNDQVSLDNNYYENVEDDHSTYTALKKTAFGEPTQPSDDHAYAFLNRMPKKFRKKNQEETVCEATLWRNFARIRITRVYVGL